MSDRYNSDPKRSGPKRRRLPGACDNCRKKKIRCDSAENTANTCSNCIASKMQCTHFYISNLKDNSSGVNYKNSRKHVAAILSTTTVYVPSDDPAVLYRILVDVAKYARNLEELLAISPSETEPHYFSAQQSFTVSEAPSAIDNSPAEDISDDGLFVNSKITDPLQRLAIHPSPASSFDGNYRFFGKSSTRMFLKNVMDLVDDAGSARSFDAQRPEFWSIQPWQQVAPETVPPQSFPDDDLLATLIDLYFERINPVVFLLHAPSFRRAVADCEHLSDRHFGGVVLMVCALAARFSGDPRVLFADNVDQRGAGWQWFRQVRPLWRLAFSLGTAQALLHKLQVICLSVLFIAQTPTPRACWLLAGFGLRLAQEMGAHRRGRYSMGSRAEAELLRRAFWVLITADTILSSLLGRPAITTMDDFDAGLPTVCDDEYWEAPHNFQQPADKTAVTAYMVPYLELMLIFNRAQHEIYPVKKQKRSSPEVVAELDSALHKWLDSIPDHLRWDPNLEGIFLDQSALLYVAYYHVQILIHRPFISAPGTASPSPFPSLAICANSARSCGHVMNIHSRRAGHILPQPHIISALFDSAVILLLNVWGGRRTRLSPVDVTRAKSDIKKCVDVLTIYEKVWTIAGRKLDMITEILNRSGESSGSSPNSYVPSPAPPLKRGRDGEDEVEASTSWLPPATAVEQLEQLEMSIQETDHLFSLPLSTQELGLLPVYDSFDFPFDFSQRAETPSPSSLESGLFDSQIDQAHDVGGPTSTENGYGEQLYHGDAMVIPGWKEWIRYVEEHPEGTVVMS